MTSSANDRNMLFGILAQQMDFITRDALIAAMHAWVQEKHKPLGQILLEQKALTADTHALLEALVKKHLALHSDDAEKSLAAVSSISSVRRNLAAITDEDIQESLGHLTNGHGKDKEPYGTLSLATAAGGPTAKGVRFRILRPHAKGGLGQVYVAYDEELNREVALKEIQGKHSQLSDARTRFMLEAEITGGLEHPGIVPVYGLGQYDDGRPFYAMRFIKGDSLKEVIAKYHDGANRDPHERALELRGLLGRLIDVCQAMRYAHARGILHRDLKPGNIMLGKYGETLVVDWGLAKAMGKLDKESAEPVLQPASASGTAETFAGTVIGTPAFMSPEQAAGRFQEMGPASDVYSLGATLFAILTGNAPVDDSAVTAQRHADLGKILKKVTAGAIRRPRQLKADVDPALEAICLKAMALKPADRYESPRALADDLERWLAGEPVIAWPEPLSVKARRWVAKNRTLVTGVAAAVLVGLVSLAVATAMLQQKNTDLTAANTVIQKQNDDIKQEIAEKEKQRKLAESRLRTSLDAVGLFANDARKYCEDAVVPGDSRRMLYEVLITQLERQVDQEPGEATLDSLRNKTWMYQTLCGVTSDFDEFSKSDDWFKKGLASVDQWEKLRPGDPMALSFRGTFLHLHGASLERRRKFFEARPFHIEALAIRRKLMANPDADGASKANAIAMVADSLDSLEQFEEALKLREQVAKMQEKDKEASFGSREAWCWTLQKAAYHAKDYAQRKAYLSKADQMSEELIDERPHSRNILLRWAMAAKAFGELEYNFGKLAEKDGKPDEALRCFAQAKTHFQRLNEVSRKLATADELVEGLQSYSRSFYTLGLVEELNKRPGDARRYYQTSRDIRDVALRAYSDYRNSAHLQIDLLFSQVALGELRRSMEITDEMSWTYRTESSVQYRLACVYALAINAVEEARKPEPLNPKDKNDQLRYHNAAIKCLQHAHDGGFSDFFHTSIDADLNSIRGDPRMKEFEASHAYRQGILAKERGDAKKARAHFEKAQELAQEWIKTLPKDSRQKNVKIVWLCAQVQLGQYAEAVEGADALRPMLLKRSPALFHLARVYSLAAAAVDDPKLQEEWRTKSLAALNQAVNVGLRQALLLEEDLAAVRGDPRFQETLRLYTEKEKSK
jgi:serine/threonine protein kinase